MKKSASSQSADPVEKKFPNGKNIIIKTGMVTSTDGTKSISLDEFDRLFDEGSDEIDAYIDWSKAKACHGGRRTGAGRKPTHRRQYTIRLKPEAHRLLKAKAASRNQTMAEFIENMI